MSMYSFVLFVPSGLMAEVDLSLQTHLSVDLISSIRCTCHLIGPDSAAAGAEQKLDPIWEHMGPAPVSKKFWLFDFVSDVNSAKGYISKGTCFVKKNQQNRMMFPGKISLPGLLLDRSSFRFWHDMGPHGSVYLHFT